jgi:hypothetical protein
MGDMVARAKKKMAATRSRSALAGIPSLTLEEGRKQLHRLADEFGSLEEPSEFLLERAVDVGKHRKGGLIILPEIDAVAALDRLEEAERENEELLDELEDIGLVLLAQERLGEERPFEELTPLDELARQFGREHLLDA